MTHQPGGQHGYVSNAGTKLEDTLAKADARFPQESFGERVQKRCLTNQALVFGVGAVQRIKRGGTTN